MTVLHTQLLGGLALAWGEVPLPIIPSVTARSLLAYLLNDSRQSRTRGLLNGTFGLPAALVRHRPSQALWQIRRTLSPHSVLLTEGDTVQFDPDRPLSIDTEQFTEYRAPCAKRRDRAVEHGETDS